MRARDLKTAEPLESSESEPPLFAFLSSWALMVLAVVAVAGLTHLAFPRWLEGVPARELPERASLVADIFANNLLIAVTPLLGGWLAAGQLVRGRPAVAIAILALPALVIARSLMTIGIVGGGDLGWLLSASRWWLLEVAALAVSAQTVTWIALRPRLREEHAGAAMKRALSIVIVLLALAAIVEVFTA